MAQAFRNHRKLHRPPLEEDLILSWADEHFRQYDVWPTAKSGPISGHDGENWNAIDSALRSGCRGLNPGSSVATLLRDRRWASNFINRAKFSIDAILRWADEYYEVHGRYPTMKDGEICGSPSDTWMAVDGALRRGMRGLPRGSSLAQLLKISRNVRNGARLKNLSIEVILQWADEHRERTGSWPTLNSGLVETAPSEHWMAINAALRHGIRGLPGGSSLAKLKQFLIQEGKLSDLTGQRFYRDGDRPGRAIGKVTQPPMVAQDLILSQTDAHFVRHSPLLGATAALTKEQIADWMQAHAAKYGQYPVRKSGAIEGAAWESWSAVEDALVNGRRGLPGGQNLSGLRRELISQGRIPASPRLCKYPT